MPILAEVPAVCPLPGRHRRRNRPDRESKQERQGKAKERTTRRPGVERRSSSSTRARSTRRSSSRTPKARSSTSTTCRPRPVSKWTKARGAGRSAAGPSAAGYRRTQDITGGLPRVTEIFEARKPKDPAAMAEISGRVELRTDKRRGKMTIIVRSESGHGKGAPRAARPAPAGPYGRLSSRPATR